MTSAFCEFRCLQLKKGTRGALTTAGVVFMYSDVERGSRHRGEMLHREDVLLINERRGRGESQLLFLVNNGYPLKYSKSAFELCNAASANQTSRSESEFREAEDGSQRSSSLLLLKTKSVPRL